MPPQPDKLVQLYLRAQNLEQMRRIDEAIVFYEQAVAAHFDAAGPYDRLIAIYRGRDEHAEVKRVAKRRSITSGRSTTSARGTPRCGTAPTRPFARSPIVAERSSSRACAVQLVPPTVLPHASGSCTGSCSAPARTV